MKKTIAIMLLVLLVGGTLLFAAGVQEPQAEQKKYVLKFNHVLTPQDPYHGAFLKWAEAVKERTNGGLTIEVFPSAQLGVEEDILEQIR